MAAGEGKLLEYRVVKDNYGKLVKDCATNMELFLNELYSKDLLESYEHSEYLNSEHMSCSTMVAEAIKRVIAKIQENSSHWFNFLQALRDSDLEPVADYLESDWKSRIPRGSGTQSKYVEPSESGKTSESEIPSEFGMPSELGGTKRNLDKTLSLEDLPEIYTAAYEAKDKWLSLGVALKISIDSLEDIEAQRKSVDHQFLKMIEGWLKNDTKPTWHKLAQALGSKAVGMHKLKYDVINKLPL